MSIFVVYDVVEFLNLGFRMWWFWYLVGIYCINFFKFGNFLVINLVVLLNF